MSMYANFATFEIAHTMDRSVVCFGVWRGGDHINEWCVSSPTLPLEPFNNKREALERFEQRAKEVSS